MVIINWILFIVLIAGVLAVGGLLLRGYLQHDTGAGLLKSGFFPPKPPQKRLDVVDQMTIDGRRRLVLIRRDNVEHLIMTGGPVDVVIETNIASSTKQLRSDPPLDAASKKPPSQVSSSGANDGKPTDIS